jgi:hypothetical protein
MLLRIACHLDWLVTGRRPSDIRIRFDGECAGDHPIFCGLQRLSLNRVIDFTLRFEPRSLPIGSQEMNVAKMQRLKAMHRPTGEENYQEVTADTNRRGCVIEFRLNSTGSKEA